MYKWVDEDGNTHYSDENPEEKSDSVQTIERSNSTKRLTAHKKLKAMVRPANLSAEPIYLNEIRYIWNRLSEANRLRKVGTYHMGKKCSPGGAIKMPRPPTTQISFIAHEKKLTDHALRIIKKIEYPVTRISNVRDDKKLQTIDQSGLVLDGEVVAMDFKTCAPGVTDLKKYSKPEQIPAGQFTKHRMTLEVRWVLRKGKQGPVVFEATGIGKYSNWKTNNSGSWTINERPINAFRYAMNQATKALYSDREFIQKITQ